MSAVVAALALFGAGLTAALSPCVLPLVPGYLGVLADDPDGSRPTFVRVVLFAAVVVITFAVLGAAAGFLGAGVGDLGRISQRIAGAVLVILAGVALAASSGRFSRAVHPLRWVPASPGWRAVALGVGCGVAWTPCTGPLLGAALTAAAAASSPARSTLLLVSYSAGVLAPFVGLASIGAKRASARLRTWGRVLRPVSAVVMIALGLVLMTGRYDGLVSRFGIVSG